MKVLAIIPARCGSKGFPDKNIARLKNKTLLELAVKVGVECKIVNDVYISTDCRKYENIALKAGAKSLGLRSKQLASDTAKSIDLIIDLIGGIKQQYDYVVLIQPTSPVRNPKDIENMIRSINEKEADASVSVSKIEDPHPYKLKNINNKGFVESFINRSTSEVPRQSLPKVYALNGAFYVSKIEIILKERTLLPEKTTPYIMDININIDSEIDFIALESMVMRNKIKVFGV
jgi:CMP-N,N'-diacetyllegionaminic acid synthase